MTPHFQVAEEAQEMARHPVARVPGGEPDLDVVVVRDVEHQSAFPSRESGRCQAERRQSNSATAMNPHDPILGSGQGETLPR
eukprot:5012152-Heterocapsa_arctica.AAC.1